MRPDTFELPSPPERLARRLADGGAIAWADPVEITSYEPGEPDRYPMFLGRRVYQGSSGKVYPLPFVDSVASEPVERSWQAVHVENRWIRLMVMPELGGRIHVGFDKTAGYDFFYRNNVIKPALVGLGGPWISGGVEFNWPQHHRPGTFLPVETEIEDHPDGSVTVWCSDHDPFARMKGMHGVRLHPDRAVVELVVRLHNRTSETQTFLWWANVAARAHDEYQSFFPADVRFVADHARRAISAFPAADRPYYGVDYPARAASGGDRLDFFRNIPVPTSYMIVDTQDDFFGGYDHAAQAGFVHVADHRIAPGKKQWTWGNAEFGQAWDRLLTDHDGPYVELMAGVYTDNQPDFSWLQPGETKTFTQAWYPIQQIGIVSQANLDAAVHLTLDGGRVRIGVAVTSERPGAAVRLADATGRVVFRWQGDLAPGTPLVETVDAPALPLHELVLSVEHEGRELLVWQPRRPDDHPGEPEVATEPPRPAEIASSDELFLTGVHLAQYRHPTRSPLPYWREAIRRDPGDSRSNLALADHHYRAGEYETALEHCAAALTRLTARNANPADGEASYLRGLVLVRLRRTDEAYDAFAKAAWDRKWAHPALVELARLDAAAGRDAEALDRICAARRLDTDDVRARVLEVVLRHRLGIDAAELLSETLALDPLAQTARLLAGRDIGTDARTVVDVALELASYGERAWSAEVLERAAAAPPTPAGNLRPIALYHLARVVDPDAADAVRARARVVDRELCFPAGLDDHDALVAALAADADDVGARSLLGMLSYAAGREQEALDHWRAAIDGGLREPVTFRNAAMATFNLTGDASTALDLYEQALELAPSDARLWYESDQLLRRVGAPASERVNRLEPRTDIVLARDDLAVEWCELLVSTGRAAEAFQILTTRRFAPWEGGEGRVLAAWDRACLALAAQHPGEQSLAFMQLALTPPENLGEARHPLAGVEERGASDDEVDYFATSLPELLLFDWPRSGS